MKKGFLFLCFLAMYLRPMAQTIVGCFVPTENKVYTSKGSKGHYNNIYTPLPTNSCWEPAATTNIPCDVCKDGLLNGGGNCIGNNYVSGFEGGFTVVPCPMDSGIPFLMISSAVLVFFCLRKNKR